MCEYQPELLDKLNSYVNRYGGDDGFVAHMDEWPKTIRKLVFSSEELMLRFKLIELIPDVLDEEKMKDQYYDVRVGRYNRILTDLSTLASEIKAAQMNHPSLQEKIDTDRLCEKIREHRRQLLLLRFEIEDV